MFDRHRSQSSQLFRNPLPVLETLVDCFPLLGVQFLIIGDSKGPFEYDLPGAELWTLDRQRSLTFSLQARLPIKHYSRKNLGYLIAIERGAGLIYETDDDNSPLGGWKLRLSRG